MIIIRKPKIMRSDFAMRAYLKLAKAYMQMAARTDSDDRRHEYMCIYEDFVNQATKAGGFFRVKDMTRWPNSQKGV